MKEEKVKKLSPIKWVAGFLALIAVMVGSIWLSFSLAGHRPSGAVPVGSSVQVGIALWFFGAVLIVLAAMAYAVVLVTDCFNFDFQRPFFKNFGVKLWTANLIMMLLLAGGIGLIAAPAVARMLSGLLPQTVLFPISFFAPFIAAQLLLIWFTIWAPLEIQVIRRRLKAMGLSDQQLAGGMYVGISDPGKASLRKFGLIEEDFGMLWLAPDQLVYYGDAFSFSATRQELIQIERKADAGNTSAYFGAVHVIAHFQFADGTQRRIRFHTEGNWTMTAKARALNRLAERIEAWRRSEQCSSRTVEQ